VLSERQITEAATCTCKVFWSHRSNDDLVSLRTVLINGLLESTPRDDRVTSGFSKFFVECLHRYNLMSTPIPRCVHVRVQK
jgi:hypothetical protein